MATQTAPGSSTTPGTLRIIGTGVAVTVLDIMLVAGTAAMLWANGRTSVIDVPFAAFIVTALLGGFLVAVRRAIAYRRRLEPTNHAAAAAERVTVVTQLITFTAGVIGWQITGVYELGWVLTVAAITLLVGNALLLMADVTTRTRPGTGRQTRVHARRLASVEMFHIVAGVVGIIGIALTAPIHLWRGDILNGSVLLIAIAIGIGVTAAELILIAARRHRTSTTPTV